MSNLHYNFDFINLYHTLIAISPYSPLSLAKFNIISTNSVKNCKTGYSKLLETQNKNYFFLTEGTSILPRTSLSFCKTINRASSMTFPAGAEAGKAVCAVSAAPTTAGLIGFAARALFLLIPGPDP
jgi:hypothetical protein